MAEPDAFVYADLAGQPHFVGRLWVHARRGRETATFAYADEWLRSDRRFALEPALRLDPGPWQTNAGRALFGALGDSAPDRWGRELIARRERRAARARGTAPRSLLEIDYLLGVSDFTRQGALRFRRTPEGEFPAPDGEASAPPLVALPRLLGAADRVLEEEETEEDLRLLLAPGSSLGGARPKASVQDADGTLSIAKFSAPDDPYDVSRWEAVALSLAVDAGIRTPAWRLEDVAGRSVLLLARFDRRQAERIPYLSAMSMLASFDGERRSYTEIADAIRQHGAAPAEDLEELWRRMVFNILVSNTDDHLRNHGFLYAGGAGWTLAPAFDLNPVPTDLKPRILSTAISEDGDTEASTEGALRVAAHFGLGADRASEILDEVSDAVRSWRRVAARLEAGNPERMASAFELAG